MINEQDEKRRQEILKKVEENRLQKLKDNEQSFIKSEGSDLIQKRMGADLFKGGMN